MPETLLFTARRDDGARTPRSWQRDVEQGHAVRLARGVYCRTSDWFRYPPWDRYLLAAVAHSSACREGAVFTGLTALILHGLPTAYVPGALQVRASSAGKAGLQQQRSPYGHPVGAFQGYGGHLRQGRGGHGRLPMLPAIRRRWLSSWGVSEAVPVEVRLSDSTVIGSVCVDPLHRAVAEVLSSEPLDVSVTPADVLKARLGGRAPALVEQALATLPTARSRKRFTDAWAFADGRSESAGESLSRARIHLLGFEVPDLQHRVLDASGREQARVDFWWKAVTLAGEFDGFQKYSSTQASPGESWRRVLEREKRREDAIRRTGAGVMRWLWRDLSPLRTFRDLLVHHGIPHR